MAVTTEKELGEKLKNNEDVIEITGDLKKKVIKIKAKGKVAWAIAFGSIAVAITAIVAMAPSAPVPGAPVIEGLVAGGAAVGAVSVLGASTTVAAIAIAFAGGGKNSLNVLRDNYSIIERNSEHIILKRK